MGVGEFPRPGGALDGVGAADGGGSDCGWLGGVAMRAAGGAATPTAGATACGLASGVIVAVGVRLGTVGIVGSADVGIIGGGIVTNGPAS